MEDATLFPRGGEQTLTALEYRDISAQALSDVLFTEATVSGNNDLEEDEEMEDAKRGRGEERTGGSKKRRVDTGLEIPMFSFKVLSYPNSSD